MTFFVKPADGATDIRAPMMANTTVLDWAKIQAQVLVLVLRAFREQWCRSFEYLNRLQSPIISGHASSWSASAALISAFTL
jgi:hypothetical protein